jgi:hypothetical protein
MWSHTGNSHARLRIVFYHAVLRIASAAHFLIWKCLVHVRCYQVGCFLGLLVPREYRCNESQCRWWTAEVPGALSGSIVTRCDSKDTCSTGLGNNTPVRWKGFWSKSEMSHLHCEVTFRSQRLTHAFELPDSFFGRALWATFVDRCALQFVLLLVSVLW